MGDLVALWTVEWDKSWADSEGYDWQAIYDPKECRASKDGLSAEM